MGKTFEKLSQFTVPVANKPGQLQSITKILTAGGINLTAIQALVNGQVAFVQFTTNTPARKVLDLLDDKGIQNAIQTNVISVQIRNQPGELNRLSTFLFKAGFNLNAVFGTVNENDQNSTIILSVDNPTTNGTTVEQVLEKYFGQVPVSA